MSPYNAYSPSLSSSRLSTYSPSTRSYSGSTYSTLSSTSSYRYKPPLFSSTLSSSKYRSPSSYSSPSTYVPSSLTRNVSTSSLTTHVPRFNSVSSYTSAILNTSDYKWRSTTSPTTTSNDLIWKSPSLSRRNSSSSLSSFSSHTPERSSRLSLPAYTSSLEKAPNCKVNSWSCDKSDDTEDKKGVRVGLNNLGNTCFMNAVLQCLCHTQPLVDYCTRGTYLSDINHRSPTHGDLVKVFAEFVKKISDSKSKAAISPYQLRSEVQRYAPRFCGDSQQDAQEFLRYLLQGLHDDINRVKSKPSHMGDYGGCIRVITDLFAGQLKSTLKCMTCNNDSITYDPFWDLSLPIPEYCEVCKKKTSSSKKIEVNKFPRVLVIHLKRFSASSYGQKLNMMIDCPLILENISEFAAQNSIGDGCSYVLYGVVDHDGSNNSGHYIAKCRNPLTKEWNEFNDSRVTKASSIVTNKSYILFYIQEGSSYF
ncbi:unnamed protein product [Larinioides sclopetarius]|uniref:Ubiquitin carboxyl-terminal hydrolase n=1 Tax=Larinioides sclopetarius TaxID=280406 RepID=A0AAV2AV98_9ARAC